MKITNGQKAYLDSLVCQRISEDYRNRIAVDKFSNYRNPNIPHALKTGWGEDKNNKVAYYIVKDPQDEEPLLFCSLKCGEIGVPFKHERLREILENSKYLLDAAMGMDAPDWAKEVVEKMKVNGKVPDEEKSKLYRRYLRNKAKWELYTDEIRLEGENIIRTKKTFAGVELVHFCIHAPAKYKWAKMGLNARSMGKTLFWQFVVPVIYEVRNLVGCEYVYLFAADRQKYGSLTNYYRELGFEIRDDLTVSKPEYDFRVGLYLPIFRGLLFLRALHFCKARAHAF
jgi:hypothetical protein